MSFLQGKKVLVKKKSNNILAGQIVTIVDGPLIDENVFYIVLTEAGDVASVDIRDLKILPVIQSILWRSFDPAEMPNKEVEMLVQIDRSGRSPFVGFDTWVGDETLEYNTSEISHYCPLDEIPLAEI